MTFFRALLGKNCDGWGTRWSYFDRLSHRRLVEVSSRLKQHLCAVIVCKSINCAGVAAADETDRNVPCVNTVCFARLDPQNA